MPLTSSRSLESLIGRVPAFAMHTVTVYICAVRVSPWLVGRWFGWVMPLLRLSAVTPAADWYLRHLELISIVPGLVAGYLVARKPDSVATWAWGLPAAVLAYKMLQYQAPSSVLSGTTLMSAFKYYFEIERVMPTMRYATPSDPVRVLSQMTVTAPFYAGVAYSLGGWLSKREFLTKLLSFGKSEE